MVGHAFFMKGQAQPAACAAPNWLSLAGKVFSVTTWWGAAGGLSVDANIRLGHIRGCARDLEATAPPSPRPRSTCMNLTPHQLWHITARVVPPGGPPLPQSACSTRTGYSNLTLNLNVEFILRRWPP